MSEDDAYETVEEQQTGARAYATEEEKKERKSDGGVLARSGAKDKERSGGRWKDGTLSMP